MKKRVCGTLIVIISMVLLWIIGPANMLKGAKAESTFRELSEFTTVDITSQSMIQEFSPKYAHLNGIRVLLLNCGEGYTGNLKIDLTDTKGKVIDTATEKLQNIVPGEWYDIKTNFHVKPGKIYNLLMSSSDTEEALNALTIGGSFDVDENLHCYVDGQDNGKGVAIGYLYYKSLPNISRAIICGLILAILILLEILLWKPELYNKGKSFIWQNEDITDRFYWLGIILIGVVILFLHVYKITSIPMGINIDEMGMGYDAFCLANYGVDRYLMKWPVYLINWGSGQNALYTFMSAILVKIFGYSVFVIRIPAMINALIIWIFGCKIIKMCFKKKYDVVLYSALFCILPQYLILTRYGLESLLMLGFSTLFLFALMYAVEHEKWYWYAIAGVCGGIMLYTYAIAYVTSIALIVLFLLYLFRIKKFKLSNVMALGVTLGIIVMPLILEQIINIFELPEIQFGVFTIPRMPYRYRGGDMNFKHVPEDFWLTIKTIFWADDTEYSSFRECLTMYWISIPFIFIGMIYETFQLILNVKRKIWNPAVLLTIWFWCMFGAGCIMGGKGPNGFRNNAIYFVTTYFLMVGLHAIYKASKKKYSFSFGLHESNEMKLHTISFNDKFLEKCIYVTIISYVLCFAFFLNTYFYERADHLQYLNWNTYEKPLEVLAAQGEMVEKRTTYLQDIKGIYTCGTLRPSPYELGYDKIIEKYLNENIEKASHEDSYYQNYVITTGNIDFDLIDYEANYVLWLTNRDEALKFEQLGFTVIKTSTHYVCFYEN